MCFWIAATSCCFTSGGGSPSPNSLRAGDADHALGAHDADLRARPRDDQVGLVGAPAHDVVAGAVGLAHDDGDLGHRRRRHRVQHLGAVADDALVLDLRADHEAGHVHEEHQRDVERVADLDEARGLVGRVVRRGCRPGASGCWRRCRTGRPPMRARQVMIARANRGLMSRSRRGRRSSLMSSYMSYAWRVDLGQDVEERLVAAIDRDRCTATIGGFSSQFDGKNDRYSLMTPMHSASSATSTSPTPDFSRVHLASRRAPARRCPARSPP